MAIWSMTIRQMQDSITQLYLTLTAKKTVSYTEREAIRFAINEALQRLCEERGVTRWRFMQEHITATCVANQVYVDLDSAVLNIITGTERIATEESGLSVVSMEALLATDVDRDEVGVPQAYALDTSATGGLRLQLFPVPSDAYVIDCLCEVVADEDTLTGIPAWMTGAVLDLATAIAMKRMGFGNPVMYEIAYDDAIVAHANKQGYDGPLHINRSDAIPTTAWASAMHKAMTS